MDVVSLLPALALADQAEPNPPTHNEVHLNEDELSTIKAIADDAIDEPHIRSTAAVAGVLAERSSAGDLPGSRQAFARLRMACVRGDYTLRAWHDLGDVRVALRVSGGKTHVVDPELPLEGVRKQHKNKYGKPYAKKY